LQLLIRRRTLSIFLKWCFQPTLEKSIKKQGKNYLLLFCFTQREVPRKQLAAGRGWEWAKKNANGTGNYFMSTHGNSQRRNILLLFLKWYFNTSPQWKSIDSPSEHVTCRCKNYCRWCIGYMFNAVYNSCYIKHSPCTIIYQIFIQQH
jgi:hypothetical protein